MAVTDHPAHATGCDWFNGQPCTALARQVLDLGGRLDGLDHYRTAASSKPSDPDDVRWECVCGYAGSPETVRRHWDVHLNEQGWRRSRVDETAALREVVKAADWDHEPEPWKKMARAALSGSRVDETPPDALLAPWKLVAEKLVTGSAAELASARDLARNLLNATPPE